MLRENRLYAFVLAGLAVVAAVGACVGFGLVWFASAVTEKTPGTPSALVASSQPATIANSPGPDNTIQERSELQNLEGKRVKFRGTVEVVGNDIGGFMDILDASGPGGKKLDPKGLGTLVTLRWNKLKIYCFFGKMTREEIQATGLDPVSQKDMDAIIEGVCSGTGRVLETEMLMLTDCKVIRTIPRR